MYCKNCGQQVGDNDAFCSHCGASLAENLNCQSLYVENNKSSVKKLNTLAIVGFILAFFVPLAGLICSIFGYKSAVNEKLELKGLSIAGIVIGSVFLAIKLLMYSRYLIYW